MSRAAPGAVCYALAMRRTFLVLSFVTFACAFVAPALGCGAASSEAQQRHEYETRGVVRAIDLEHRSITIAHENVPGYMPPMTMPFELADVAQVQGISVGDRIVFRFRPEAGGRHVIVTIRRR